MNITLTIQDACLIVNDIITEEQSNHKPPTLATVQRMLDHSGRYIKLIDNKIWVMIQEIPKLSVRRIATRIISSTIRQMKKTIFG